MDLNCVCASILIIIVAWIRNVHAWILITLARIRIECVDLDLQVCVQQIHRYACTQCEIHKKRVQKYRSVFPARTVMCTVEFHVLLIRLGWIKLKWTKQNVLDWSGLDWIGMG